MKLKEYQKYIKLLSENKNNIPQKLFNDKTFVELALYYIPEEVVVPLVSNELKKDEQFILFMIKGNADAFKYFDESIRDQKELMLKAVRVNGLAFEHCSDRLKNDKEVALEAVKNNGHAYFYASNALQKDKEVILEAVKDASIIIRDIPEALFSDKQFVIELFKAAPLLYEEEGMKKYLNDKDILLTVLTSKSTFDLMFLPEKFKDDKDVMKAVIMNNNRYEPSTIINKVASKRLQDDPELMLEVFAKEDRIGYRKLRSIDFDEDKSDNSNLTGGDFD